MTVSRKNDPHWSLPSVSSHHSLFILGEDNVVAVVTLFTHMYNFSRVFFIPVS